MYFNSLKSWVGKIVKQELNPSNVWLTWGVGIAILILPRVFPISVNYLSYDDFIARPLDLLAAHRPVGAAEEAFWFHVYGPDYLRSYIPKLVSFTYIMVGVWTLVQIFRAWRIPFVTAFLAVLLFLINPILTELLVWNTISADNLALTLVLLGYWAQLEGRWYALVAGTALGFLALATYQPTVGLPAMLVLIEATLLLIRNGESSIPWNWKRRLVWVALPMALYAVYLVVAKYVLGYSVSGTNASRGLATSSEMLSFAFLLQKYHEASHGLAGRLETVGICRSVGSDIIVVGSCNRAYPYLLLRLVHSRASHTERV
jgi:hypothetical protein